jgi:hypothetical protein
MEATNLADLYHSPLLDWAPIQARLAAGLSQAPGTGARTVTPAGLTPRTATAVGTINPGGATQWRF